MDALRRTLRAPDGLDYSFWSLNLRYTLGTYSTLSARYLTVEVSGMTPPKVLDAHGSHITPPRELDARTSSISVGSHPAELIRYPGKDAWTEIAWSQQGLYFIAGMQLDADYGLANLLPLLRSIR